MTELFLGFAALVLWSKTKSLYTKLGRIKNPVVWELDPGFVSKNALAIAFEGNGKRTVMWRQKKVVEVRIPLRKPKEMK